MRAAFDGLYVSLVGLFTGIRVYCATTAATTSTTATVATISTATTAATAATKARYISHYRP